MKIVLFIVVIIGFLYFCFIKFFGNWRATVNSVITTFISVSKLYPDACIGELFCYTLDARYPFVSRGSRSVLYQRNEAVGRSIIELSCRAEPNPLKSLLGRYTLPSLVLRCLLVEQNSITRKKKYDHNPQLLYDMIESEICRQGFSKYCVDYSFDDIPG